MIHISEPDLNGNEEKYLLEAFRSGWLSTGEFNIRLEKELRDYFRRETILTSSGTTALHLLLLAYGISSGDEVIVSAQSFAATANAVLYTGAKPIFVDVDEETWNIDPSKIESAISPKTKAILVTHLFGNPCDISEIQALCKRYSLLLFEDAAEAIGAKYKNQLIGHRFAFLNEFESKC
jgi:perosamine synthetase